MKSLTTSAIITIQDADSQKLPIYANKPLLFLCNRCRQGFDEEILNTLLSDRYPMLKIITADVEKKNSFYIFPDFLTRKDFEATIPVLKKAVHDAHQSAPVFAMPINFTTPLWGEMVYQSQLNRFFRTVRNTGFTVVLLHLSSDEDMSDVKKMIQNTSIK